MKVRRSEHMKGGGRIDSLKMYRSVMLAITAFKIND